MVNGEVRTDETHRFHLAFQPDGNLVVYAYVIEPNIQRIAIGSTGTYRMGPNLSLHLNPGGWLEMLDTGSGARRWFRPEISDIALHRPQGVPNSTLHLQPDGRLVLYRPGGFTPDHATWAIAGVSQQTNAMCVIPGTLILDVSEGGRISAQFDKHVVNDTPDIVGVRDGHTFIALPPGGQAGVITPGTLVITGNVFEFPASGAPGTANAVPAKKYGPGQNIIHATGSGRGGFGLV